MAEHAAPAGNALQLFLQSLLPSFNGAGCCVSRPGSRGAVERQAGQPAPFAVGALPGAMMQSVSQLAQSARGLFAARPAPAAPAHQFDEEDALLQDILAQFPDDLE